MRAQLNIANTIQRCAIIIDVLQVTVFYNDQSCVSLSFRFLSIIVIIIIKNRRYDHRSCYMIFYIFL